MATVSVPRSRAATARHRQPSALAAPATPSPARSQLIDRIEDIKVDTSPEDTQLPSLLKEAESLAKSFEALQVNGGDTRQDDRQARAARRAKRRRKGGASTEKLPVFATRSTTRGQSRPRGATATRQRASTASLASAVPFTQSPASISSESALVTTGLSARRNQQSRNWGKAKAQQQVEHTWNGIATQTRTTSLKPKEELDLTTRLKKYFKLKDRYDALSEELGYTPGMDEFARRLGTDKVSAISTIMTDGPKQKAAMVRHNMGLVVNIISKYDHPDVTREEMKSSAVEGLVHAVKLFEPSKGFKFSTYAHWWVRQSVNRILAVESRVVYVPQNVYEASIQAQTIASELSHQYYPEPVPDEVIASKMNVSLKRLKDIRSAVKDPVSMNAPVSSSGEAEFGELYADNTAVRAEDLLIEDSMQQTIDSYLRQLPPREAGVLRMRYGLGGFERPHTLEEIGFRYAVTRERIRQIERKAFGDLRRSSFTDELADYTLDQDEDLSRTSSAVGRKSA